MKDGHKHRDEILKEVAEEEGLNMREVRDVWNHQKKYIKKKTKEEDVYSIFFPFVGHYCFNTKLYDTIKNNSVKNKYYKDTVKKNRKLRSGYFPEYQNAHKRVTGLNRVARRVVSDYETGRDYKRLIAPRVCWEIVEKYSNGQYDKKEDN